MEKIKIDEIKEVEDIGIEPIGVVRKVEGVICKLVAVRKGKFYEQDTGSKWTYDAGELPENIEKIVKQDKIQEAEKQGYIFRLGNFVVEVWELIPQEKIVKAARKNLLEKGRSIATGIGVFAAVYTEDGKILLRVRTEKDSMYGEDLSGKPELPGGGTDMEDFEQIFSGNKYADPAINTLARELEEETGLLLRALSELKMYPAWLFKEPLIDLAFVVPVKDSYVKKTDKYKKMEKANQVRFFTREEIANANITSPRMRFLIESAFSAIQK